MCSDRQMKMDCEIQQWQSAVNERRAKMKAHPKPRHSAHYGMAPHAVSADEGGGGTDVLGLEGAQHALVHRPLGQCVHQRAVQQSSAYPRHSLWEGGVQLVPHLLPGLMVGSN